MIGLLSMNEKNGKMRSISINKVLILVIPLHFSLTREIKKGSSVSLPSSYKLLGNLTKMNTLFKRNRNRIRIRGYYNLKIIHSMLIVTFQSRAEQPS